MRDEIEAKTVKHLEILTDVLAVRRAWKLCGCLLALWKSQDY